MRALVVSSVVGALLLGGCVSMPKPGTPEWVAMTTRSYPESPEEVFRTVPRALQSIGGTVKTADKDAATIIGSVPRRGSDIWEYSVVMKAASFGTSVSLLVTLEMDYMGSKSRTVKKDPELYQPFFEALDQELAGP